MANPWLHRLALVIAVLALVALVFGALATDTLQARFEHPAAGDSAAGLPAISAHVDLGWLVAALVLVLAAGLTVAREEKWLLVLGWLAFALTVFEAVFGKSSTGTADALRSSGSLHALTGQFFFGVLVAIVLGTSALWKKGPDLVYDQGWPSLRFLGTSMLVLVLLQVGLGAAFRHKAMGLMPHLMGAMVVALWILIVCMFVMQQFPEHKALRPAANLLLAVTLTQVFLGIAALTMRMLSSENTTGLLISTAGHVTTGAMTLGATVILTMQIRRNVQPKLVVEEVVEEAS